MGTDRTHLAPGWWESKLWVALVVAIVVVVVLAASIAEMAHETEAERAHRETLRDEFLRERQQDDRLGNQ